MTDQTVTISPARYLAYVRDTSTIQTNGAGGPIIGAKVTYPGFSFVADVTVEETAVDELTITQHPVEQGANITDHAFKNPSRVSIRVAWSNSGAKAAGNQNYVYAIYQKMLATQLSRKPFSTQTGKRLYTNMLFRSLTQQTDQHSETTLLVTAELQEIIIVQTVTTNIPDQSVQAAPQKNCRHSERWD